MKDTKILSELIAKYPQLSQDEILECLKNEEHLKIFGGTLKVGIKVITDLGYDAQDELTLLHKACMIAIDKYDVTQGAKFVNYLCWRIRGLVSGKRSGEHTKSNRLETVSYDHPDYVEIAVPELPESRLDLYNIMLGLARECLTQSNYNIFEGIGKGLSQTKIARDMGISHQAVSARYIRSLERVKNEWSKYEDPHKVL